MNAKRYGIFTLATYNVEVTSGTKWKWILNVDTETDEYGRTVTRGRTLKNTEAEAIKEAEAWLTLTCFDVAEAITANGGGAAISSGSGETS